MKTRAAGRAAVVMLGAGALAVLGLVLVACPVQPTYPSTITPIYAATSGSGLYVYNGSSWTTYAGGGSSLTSVVVSGSGSGAEVFAGGSSGVSYYDGSTWTSLSSGLPSTTVNSLVIGSTLYAGTAGGIAVLSGSTWSSNTTPLNVNHVFLDGSYTLVAANAGLYIYNGTALYVSYTPAQLVGTAGSVTTVAMDSSGDLYVGTASGLAVSSSTASFGTNQLPGSYHVYGVAFDSSDNSYVATSNGLYINLGTTPAFSGSTVYSVWVDGKGSVYAGVGTSLEVSTDGGSTWTSELTAGSNITSIVTTAPLYQF